MEFYEGVARQSGKLDEFCSSSTGEGKALFTVRGSGDGTWGDWSDWACPKPCLTNPVQQQTRTRDCTGSSCPGLAEESNGVDCTQGTNISSVPESLLLLWIGSTLYRNSFVLTLE